MWRKYPTSPACRLKTSNDSDSSPEVILARVDHPSSNFSQNGMPVGGGNDCVISVAVAFGVKDLFPSHILEPDNIGMNDETAVQRIWYPREMPACHQKACSSNCHTPSNSGMRKNSSPNLNFTPNTPPTYPSRVRAL